MISLYPTFYHTFQCKADKCNHTCCQKWTIDIDETTAAYYESLPTPLGAELRQAMTIDAEGHHFVFTDEQPTCALLNDAGLCRVVLELGEDGLCETCHMHPRFYKYIEDLELCGVGLSCEASVSALMDGESPYLQFTIEDDDNEFTEEDQPVLENIFQLLALDIDEHLCHFAPILDIAYYQQLINMYSQTEAIDEEWTHQLQTLLASINTDTFKDELSVLLELHKASLNKLYQYILYRQIDMLADYSLDALIAYASDATHFIALSAMASGDLPEQIRRWSEQMEYNEDNVQLLFELNEV